jgi:hypothetical protein
MPIEYILLVISNNHKERNHVRVLTSRVLKLEKLQEDILQFEVNLGIWQWKIIIIIIVQIC